MAFIALLVILAGAVALSYLWLSQDVMSDVEVRNPEGHAGTALLVYHPGRSDFHRELTGAFADGLISNGWRVEITTASPHAPTDLSEYDLLVLGGPTYWFTPSRPIRRYLGRLGDLGGKPTVTIITAMGAGGRSAAIMEKDVREANGDLVKSLLLYTVRPNEDLYGINDAVEIATQTAKQIPLPGE